MSLPHIETIKNESGQDPNLLRPKCVYLMAIGSSMNSITIRPLGA